VLSPPTLSLEYIPLTLPLVRIKAGDAATDPFNLVSGRVVVDAPPMNSS
jgi:hypothetical protein